MMDACRRDGHNYVTKRTNGNGDIRQVYCTKCGEVEVLVVEGGATPESGTEPVVLKCGKCGKCGKETGDKYVATYSSGGTPSLEALCMECADKSESPIVQIVGGKYLTTI